MTDTITVTVHGDGYDDEIDIFQADDTRDLDTAIRRVSQRMISGGWPRATVRRKHFKDSSPDIVVHIFEADVLAAHHARMARIYETEAEWAAAKVLAGDTAEEPIEYEDPL